MIKIASDAAVNPRHVIAVMRNKQNLTETLVVLIGMQSVKSDHDFETTIKMLEDKPCSTE